MLFQTGVIPQETRVKIPGGTNHPGGVAAEDGKVGEIALYMAVGRYQAALANGGAGTDQRMRPDKGIRADVDRPALI